MIEIYEGRNELKLPDQYKTFLIKYNGGETPNTSFDTGDEASDLKGFYGLGDNKYSLDKVALKASEGENYLPIALDSFGNDILINIKMGSIYFHNHENGKMIKITEDFGDFINICKSEPVKKSAVKSIEEREKDLIKKGRGSVITDALREMWRQEIKKYSTLELEEVVL